MASNNFQIFFMQSSEHSSSIVMSEESALSE